MGTWEFWLCWSGGEVRWEEKRSLTASTYVKQQGSSSVSDWGSGPTWAPRCSLKHINHPKQGHHGHTACRERHTHTHRHTHNKAGWRARARTRTHKHTHTFKICIHKYELDSIWCIQRLMPSQYRHVCMHTLTQTHTHTQAGRQAGRHAKSHWVTLKVPQKACK